MGEKMRLRDCDNPSGEWCKDCRNVGMSHCSDPGHCGQMQPMAHHANCSHCRPDTGNAEVDRLIGRLMSADPSFDDCTDAAVLIRRLARAHLTQPAQAVDVDALAQEIRRVDGNHSLGAGALAEALMPFLTAALPKDSNGAEGV